MKKTNKLFAAFLMVALATSGCSLLPNKPQSRNKSSKEESSQVVEDDFDAKTHEIYDLYRANGGTLTYEEWLESIKGEKGEKGDQGIQGEKGEKGDKGDQGEQGAMGPNGVDGQTPYIGNNGNWWVANQDTGVCAGGQNGVSIVSTVINSEGELIITFSDGTSQNAGRLTYTEHIHEYESNIVNATCTTDGYVTFTCKTCGHIETVVNKAQGHVFEAWRESTPATCYSNGLKVRYCSMCGERQQETIPMHDHTISASYVHNSMTHWHYCTECGVVLEEANHDFVNGVCSICGSNEIIPSADSGMIYSLNSDGNSYTLADLGSLKDSDVAIPSLYNGKPVTAIGDGAFANSSINSITMPDTIEAIGAGCFKECSNLSSVVLSKNITRIENQTFSSCRNLRTITIPNGVEYVGMDAFAWSGLTSIVFPDTVTCLDSGCVWNCTSLVRVVLPSNLSSMGGSVFGCCYCLSEVIIPEGCKTIGSSAFSDDNELESIYIPSTIEVIENGAFRSCSSLTSAIFADPENWRVGQTLIAKEILQDGEVAARKLLALSDNNWYHDVNNG